LYITNIIFPLLRGGNSMNRNIAEKIKSIKWDNRVARPGFLQSKQSILEAEIQPIKLTPNIAVKYDHIFWINDFNLYDEEVSNSFAIKFEEAFQENSKWPLKIVSFFNKIKSDIENLDDILQKTDWDSKGKEEKISVFKKYIKLLEDVQKYYVIAVPLTTYCEKKIIESNNQEFLEFYAVPIQQLDVNEMNDSIENIKRLQEGDFRDTEIKKHLEKYAWIKTGYNIIQPYTKADIENELKQSLIDSEEKSKPSVPGEIKPYVQGLQVGIYLRNRMKEISQRLWFAFEKLGKSMAQDLKVSRDDFFELRYREVVESYNKGNCVVSGEEIEKRKNGFVSGYLGRKEILLTGREVEELEKYFDPDAEANISEIKGTIACTGSAKGIARIITHSSHFNDFKENEILVTRMTTPDFVVIMKKAAAIVTNEGGLSSHAAIVSRELGIPCIIGTKIATKVFKDGDRIEVDAEHGIVRKIS